MEHKGSEFFQNCACEYFPCHNGINEDEFNCLFCYCPLYLLGRDCDGDYEYLENGIKSCMNCTIPHAASGYAYIQDKFEMIKEKIRQNPETKNTEE